MAVSKPNSIKNMFMNSNVKKPAEVRSCFITVSASYTVIALHTHCVHFEVVVLKQFQGNSKCILDVYDVYFYTSIGGL